MRHPPSQALRAVVQRTRRASAFALLPFALVTLAACSVTGGSTTPPGGGVVSSGPLPTPSTAPMSPNPVTPEPIRDPRKQTFSRAAAGPSGNTVRVEGLLVGGPPCNVIGRADVKETATRVTITLWAGPRRDANCDGPQPALEFPFVLELRLEQPLGNRLVVDGAH